jgi:hypothetical protein
VVDDQSTESSGLGNFSEQVWSVFSERGHLHALRSLCDDAGHRRQVCRDIVDTCPLEHVRFC